MNKKFNQLSYITLGALFAVVLIDSVGTSLILPLLEPLFLAAHNVFTITLNTHQNILYGISLSSFAAAMFIGSPLLGSLSDRYGRKTTLLYCLLGTLLGYLLSGYAIIIKNTEIFVLGRIIDGFTAGSLPIAQAAIIDKTDVDDRPKYFGYVLFAVSIAYVCGPLFASFFANSNISRLFSVYFPFFLIAALSLLNIAILHFFYQEKTFTSTATHIEWLSGIKHFINAFKFVEIRKTIFIFLCLQFGWTGFFQFVGMYASKRYLLNTTGISINLAFIGLGMAFAFCYLIGKLSKNIDSERVVLLGFPIEIGLFLVMWLSHSIYLFNILSFAAGVIYGCLYPALLTLLSKQTNEKAQGLIMGIAGALSAVSASATAFLGGIYTSYRLDSIIFFPLIMLVIGIVIKLAVQTPRQFEADVK